MSLLMTLELPTGLPRMVDTAHRAMTARVGAGWWQQEEVAFAGSLVQQGILFAGNLVQAGHTICRQLAPTCSEQTSVPVHPTPPASST